MTFSGFGTGFVFVSACFFAACSATSSKDVGTSEGRADAIMAPSPSPPSQPGAALRLPLLDTDDRLLPARNAPGKFQFPATAMFDSNDGLERYEQFVVAANAQGFDMLELVAPRAFETADPATSICFTGSPAAVEGVVDTLVTGAFSDELTIFEVSPTANLVRIEYAVGDAEGSFVIEIPRCL